jgi:hypothetical protein
MSQHFRNTFSCTAANRLIAMLAAVLALPSCSGDSEELEKHLAAARATTAQLQAEIAELKTQAAATPPPAAIAPPPAAPVAAPATLPAMPDVDVKLLADPTFQREQSLAFKAYEIRHTLNEMPGFGTIREVRFKAIERQDTGDPAHPENKDRPYRAGFSYLIDLGQQKSILLDFIVTANTQSKWDAPTAEMVATRYREAKAQLETRLAQNSNAAGTANPPSAGGGGGGSGGFSERGDGTVVFSWAGGQAQPQAGQPQSATQPPVGSQLQPSTQAPQAMAQPSTRPAAPPTAPALPAAVMPVQDTKIINFDRK